MVSDWWRLAVVGSWWLARLVVGGWWLSVGGWRLVVGGWRRLAVDGSWRLAVGGPLGQSLRAVLSKRKIWYLKDRPVVDWVLRFATLHHNGRGTWGKARGHGGSAMGALHKRGGGDLNNKQTNANQR